MYVYSNTFINFVHISKKKKRKYIKILVRRGENDKGGWIVVKCFKPFTEHEKEIIDTQNINLVVDFIIFPKISPSGDFEVVFHDENTYNHICFNGDIYIYISNGCAGNIVSVEEE